MTLHLLAWLNGWLMLAPALIAGQAAPAATLHLIGDSTIADKPLEGNPERGWGQALPLFFDGRLKVINHAVNGRSSKSFIDEGRWDAVTARLNRGDFLFVQFGHNDQKQEDPRRYTDPDGAFKQNLERFVREARVRGARPVLLTPVMRRRFDNEGMFYDTHGRYPNAVREVARGQAVALIDLHRLMGELISKLGEEGSKDLFLWIPPGRYIACLDGRQDDTHFSERGAVEVAQLAAGEIRRQGLPLEPFLRQRPAAPESLSAKGTYLFSYFLGSGQDGLHLASSEDGLSWKELDNYKERIVPAVGSDKLMRDPCILQGPDGIFHMVWTVSWREKGIGYASSADLIHWSEQRYLPVMEREPQARNSWAPEIIYDEENGRHLIFWATTIPGRFPMTDGQNRRGPEDPGLDHRIYCVTSRDMKSFSPTSLFFDQGFNVIDATIVRDGSRHVMFLKDETNQPFTPQKNIRWTASDRAEGPYQPVSAPITGSYWAEGPSALKIGETWVVYFDRYRENRYGAVVTQDFKEWKDISDRLRFPANARHGTVFRVSQEILAGLMGLK